MLKDLILRAKAVLDEPHPPEQELVEVENALSAFLEALATERIAEPVDFTELEHANRLLREVRRERSRRLAEMQYQDQAAKPVQPQNTPTGKPQGAVNVSPQFGEDDTYDPLRKFLSSSHDPRLKPSWTRLKRLFMPGIIKRPSRFMKMSSRSNPGGPAPKNTVTKPKNSCGPGTSLGGAAA